MKKVAMEDFDLYKLELKDWYEKVKGGDRAMYLALPAQAKLRKLCVGICRKGNKQDLIAFRNFLGFEFGDDVGNKIKLETDRFRPIVRFMKNQSVLADIESVEMFAVLIDYSNRPFQKFQDKKQIIKTENEVVKLPANETEEEIVEEVSIPDPSKTKRPLATGIFITCCMIGMIGLGVYAFVLPEKNNCMQWQTDHYERVSCEVKSNSENIITPIDIGQVNMRKVRVTEKSVLFTKGKARYWYLRRNGHYEFFDTPGYHPIDPDRKLNPVSTIIARGVRDGKITSE